MKKIILVTFCILGSYSLKIHAAFNTSPIPIANNESWKNLKAAEFVKLSVKDFSKLSGKKLTLKEKISFSVLKQGMKKELKKNPNLTVNEYLNHKKKLGTGWIILIAAVGGALLIVVIALISGAGDIGL